MKTKAIYAGSFDPGHLGHMDIIRRAAKMFDLTVLVANNPSKKYLLSFDERTELVNETIRQITMSDEELHISVGGINVPNYLVADVAFENNVPVLVRGVRNLGDYDMEKMMRDINVGIQNGVETVLLTGDPKYNHVSSSAVKELFSHAGFIHEYVPLWVKSKIERNAGQYVIGVTGNIASGKSYIVDLLMKHCYEMFNLDLDMIAHHILFVSKTPVHRKLRSTIRKLFILDNGEGSDEPLKEEERVKLGNDVFGHKLSREQLNELMRPHILTAIRRSISGKKGIILVNGALLAEFKLTHICNNDMILVRTDDASRTRRLKERGLTDTQIEHRLQSQYSDEEKKQHIIKAIDRDGHGRMLCLDNNDGIVFDGERLVAKIKENFGVV